MQQANQLAPACSAPWPGSASQCLRWPLQDTSHRWCMDVRHWYICAPSHHIKLTHQDWTPTQVHLGPSHFLQNKSPKTRCYSVSVYNNILHKTVSNNDFTFKVVWVGAGFQNKRNRKEMWVFSVWQRWTNEQYSYCIIVVWAQVYVPKR